MIRLEGRRVCLITGASTGIGLATAKKMLEDGCFVILTARESSLNRFNGLGFLRDPSTHWIRPLDVTSAVQRRELIDEISRTLGRLDILINNAGVLYRTPIECASELECNEQMQVNFHAPLEIIKVAMPLMRAQGGGHIINMSSAAGFFAVPTMGLYAASKFALEGASEALQHELRPWKIHLTLVEPGFVSSPADPRLGAEFNAAERWRGLDDYRLQNSTVNALVEWAVHLTTATPEKVAVAISQVARMRRPPLRTRVTLDAQVFHFLKCFLPERVFDGLVGVCLRVMSRPAASAAGTSAPQL